MIHTCYRQLLNVTFQNSLASSANCRHGYTVADLAMGRSPPAFLVQAFEGQLAGCLRVASLAVGSTNGENGETEENENAMIEVHF